MSVLSVVRVPRVWLAVLVMIFSLAPLRPVAGQDTTEPTATAQPLTKPVVLPGVKLGFDNKYKLGVWIPLEVTLQGGRERAVGRISISSVDGDEFPCIYDVDRAIQLLPNQKLPVQLFARFGRFDAPLRINFNFETASGEQGTASQFFDSNGAGVQLPPPLEPGTDLILNLGPSLGLDQVAATQRWSGSAPAVARLGEMTSLPTRWYGYEGVDLIVLSTGFPELFDQLQDVQRKALLEWLQRGGRLLLSVGASAPRLLAADQWLAAVTPGKFARLTSLPSGRQFEQFAEVRHRLLPLPETQISVAVLDPVQGRILLEDNGLPLIVRSAYGLGTVTCVTTDLGQGVFVEWAGRNAFFNRLLNLKALGPLEEAGDTNTASFMQDRTSDIYSELRVGLEKFEGVRLVPFGLVALLIVLYILLIGPGDYFLVKYGLKRMEATWLTFPLMVVLVSVGAYFLAAWLKGDQVRINQAAVVNLDVANGQLQGTAWINLFSPQTETFDFTFHPRANSDTKLDAKLDAAADSASQIDVLLSWLGIPESTALGGMNRGSSMLLVADQAYHLNADAGTINGVPIQVASTKAFNARWSQPAQYITATAKLQQLTQGAELERLELTSSLPFELKECLLIVGTNCFSVPNVQPGKPLVLEPLTLERVSLNDKLTLMQQVFDAEKNQYVYRRQAYSAGRGNIRELLSLMMFFDSLEGRDYTKLTNSYQRYVDASNLLGAGQAILLGWSDEPAGELFAGGQPQTTAVQKHTTAYRLIFDLQKLSAPAASQPE